MPEVRAMTAREAHTAQTVTASAGVAYGVIGADLHVFGDGSPLYLLENWRRPGTVDSQALRAQPSRMLNARHAVVDFTGREQDLAQLREWRGGDHRLALRWLHGPGGQGKSRLAARFAEESVTDGWKVVSAIHGPGSVLPGDRQEDMQLAGAAGLLLIADYADQWPLTHLTWLFSNSLLHQIGVPTRILLLARTHDAWPTVRATLASHQAATSAQHLPALTDTEDRSLMFRAARDSFARHYAITDPGAIAAPAGLDGPELGLTLAVHMAALVAVDAYATGAENPLPADMAALTVYLLDREHLHWARLHAEESHRMNPSGRRYVTPPTVMNKVVFIATLTGLVDRRTGRALLTAAPTDLDADQALSDHATCYPPGVPGPGYVLEPLYPDRLAEDFLALTIPGHSADYPAQPWAGPTADTVLRRPGGQATTRTWTPRAVTFLASAATRWVHVGPNCLYPLLLADPQLAYDAGSAALVAVTAAEGLDADLLEALARLLPAGQHADLDVGGAAVTERATALQLEHASDPGERAYLLTHLGQRLSYAGRHEDALEPVQTALALRREIAAGSSPEDTASVADTLNLLGIVLTALGRYEESLAVATEALDLYRQLAATAVSSGRGGAALPSLSIALHNAARLSSLLGDQRRALEHAQQALAIDSALARELPGAYTAAMGESMSITTAILSELGRHAEALEGNRLAVRTLDRLAAVDPAAHLPALAVALNNLAITLSNLGQLADAVPPAKRATEILRKLAKANPDAYLPELGNALTTLGARYSELGEFPEATPVEREAVEIFTRLAAASPAAHLDGLARALHNLSGSQMVTWMRHRQPEQFQEGIELERRSVEIRRTLADASPAAHEQELAEALSSLGFKLSQNGRHAEGLAPTEEALTTFRRLAAADPGTHLARLALALYGFAQVRASGGIELPQARAAYHEAFRIWRGLAESDPGAPMGHLASALIGFVTTRATSGISAEEALAAIEEATDILETSMLRERGRNQLQSMGLLGAYQLWAGVLDEVGRTKEAARLRAGLARLTTRQGEHPSPAKGAVAGMALGLRAGRIRNRTQRGGRRDGPGSQD